MKITKLEHSGIMIENAGKTLLCDPVEFGMRLPNFFNVSGIIITHKHGDHLQPDVINRILTQHPAARVFTTIDASMLLPNSIIVQNGSVQEIEGFRLEFFGENHASILDGQIPCQNIGVLINGTVINPGDSFDLPTKFDGVTAGAQPDARPKVLLAPLAAPWCKVAESVDFVRRAQPLTVIPFHDAVLSDLGKGFNNNVLKSACETASINFAPLKFGENLEA